MSNATRLNGWKAIANFLGRERTTAIRWARDRGLPVHRVPGGQTASVYALSSELDAWLSSSNVSQNDMSDRVADPSTAQVAAIAGNKDLRRASAVIAACAFSAVIAGWWTFGRASATANAPVSIAAVASSTASVETAEFARALNADLALFATASANLAVFEPKPEAKLDTQYAIRTEIERADNGIIAHAQLIAVKNGEVLWSRRYVHSEEALSTLREQIAASIVGMLQCSFGTLDDERPKARSSDVALLMAICQDFEDTDFSSAQTRARRFTTTRPDLAVGWAWLAVVQGNMLSETNSTLRSKAIANAKRAWEIGPGKACTWLAQAAVAGRGFTSPDALPFIQKGLNLHPDNPYLLAQHSLILLNLGYVRDSVAPALTALRNDPSSLRRREVAIRRLAAANRMKEARQLQDENEKLWPDHPQTSITQAQLFGDRASKEKADLVAIRDGEIMIAASPHLAYQLASLYERRGEKRSALGWLARAPIDHGQQPWSQLFSPDSAGLRAEPAFFRKMADLGLVRWWVTYNKWPDFCTEVGLKYQCADEAEKLGITRQMGTAKAVATLLR